MNKHQDSVEQFLYRMAEFCDRQQWDEYLALFDRNCVFHVPQWDSEHVYTTDPAQGMSLIYYTDRSGLEDRVYRIRTGKSAASTPLPRTMHQINNVRITERSDSQLDVKVNWATFHTRHGDTSYFYGHATYVLAPLGDTWKVTRKHVLLFNDRINEVLDFYHL
jgi:anthranilate 1,2-dioxygenase (deaminating, decarboxylating) small subunit